jgi:hypothetical protein
MYSSLIPLAGWGLTVLVVALSWWRGGTPERAGSVLILVVAVLARVIDITAPPEWRQVAHLANDAMLGVGFLIVAVLYGSLWLGGAMMFQAAQFSLHAFYFVTNRPRDQLYAVVNNLNTTALMLCIIAGALVAWWQSAKSRKANQA